MKLFGFEINRPAEKQVNNTPETFNGGKYTFAKAKYNYNEPIQEVINDNYIAFGQDNLYPNHLNELYYSSPFHSSIINFKSLSLIGGGLIVTPSKEVNMNEMVLIEQMVQRFNDEFLQQLSLDFLIHSRICHKIYWNDDHTKIVNIERIDPAKVRAGKKVDGKISYYLINSGWAKSGIMGSSSNGKMEKIPSFDRFKKDEKCQMYVWQKFSPGLEYYSQPVYANAANWIFLDGQISYYHKSNIENSINPSIIIKIYEKPANEEEKQSFARNLQRSFGGASEAGQAMVFFANGKDLAPDVETIQSNVLDEAFQITQEMIIKNIAFSHTIDPVIMGISTPGALGQSQQLADAYKIFQNTFTLPNQKYLNNIMNFYMGINGVPAKVTLNTYSYL